MDPSPVQNRIPMRSVAYRPNGPIRPQAYPSGRIFTVRPMGNTVVHRLTPARQPSEIIDVESEEVNYHRPQQIRQYSSYPVNNIDGVSRVRYSIPPMNRRPIYTRPMLRPTIYRTYPGTQQMIGRHRVIPYIPRHISYNRRYGYDPTEEEIDHAIHMEESKMLQEDGYLYSDPDFQRIEANIVKKESAARHQLEKQRLATLTTYHSRSAVQSEQNRQVQQIVQRLMSAPSELSIKPNDNAIDTDAKMSLKTVIDRICQLDREEGWHKNILQKIRRVPEVPFLHSQPLVKRSLQKHSEVVLNERSEFFKREILKRRARLELDVELEYGFVKQTRTGTIACLPCTQIYARIGAPMQEEDIFPTKSEPIVEEEESYIYNVVEPIKEEYAMESEMHDIDETAQDQYLDSSGIKLETSESNEMMSPRKVEIFRGIKTTDGKRTKPGRPTNKEKRQIERETKKILKKQRKTLSHDFEDYNGIKVCYCQKVFDPTLDHIKCTFCKQLYHPKCAKLTVSKAEKLTEWYCETCHPTAQAEEATDEVYCICNLPYDPTAHWIGCNLCDKWFHPQCVNTTIEAVQEQGEYICNDCAFRRNLQSEPEEEAILHGNEDEIYYA